MAGIRQPFSLNKGLFTPRLYKRILDVWFEAIPANTAVAPETAVKKWFGVGTREERELFDESCRACAHHALDSIRTWSLPPLPDYATEVSFSQSISAPFLAEIQESAAQAGDEGDLITPTQTALSLVLLLDQFPRNIFRKDQKLIYTYYDIISRSLCRTLLQLQPRPDLHPSIRLCPTFRFWFYLPLMHSEHLEDHDTFDRVTSEMRSDIAQSGSSSEALKFLDDQDDFEKKHRIILEQFGRYPYRNAAIGRETTEKEKRWLTDGGQTFGTA